MSDSIKNIVGENFRKYRKEANISQYELAIKVETSQNVISKIENGRQNFSINAIERYSAGLEVPTYKLFIPQEEEDL